MFSVGKVGCLAIDALIATYKLKLVGYIQESHVLPAVGNDALALTTEQMTGQIHLSLEVYFSAERQLVAIQQRAPVAKVCVE
jgi:predicted ATP-grasp superfamily ATP-dependent carboligase